MQVICVLIVTLTAALPAMSGQHQKHRQQRAHQRQLFKPPATASASRAQMQLCVHDMSSQDQLAASSSGHGGAAEIGQIDHEEEAGCDVLVKYLLREFLGGDQPTQL